MSYEQTKCSVCCRRFGEMDDEPLECEDCDLQHCPDCICSCTEENKEDTNNQ